MAKTDSQTSVWADRADWQVRCIVWELGRSKKALIALGLKLNWARKTKKCMETFEGVFSVVIGKLMRQWNIHEVPISRNLLLRKEESVALPDGIAGTRAREDLAVLFPDIDYSGLWRWERELIPAHHITTNIFGSGSVASEIEVQERLRIQHYVVSDVAKKLDKKDKARIAIALGNKPTLKVVPLPDDYKMGR